MSGIFLPVGVPRFEPRYAYCTFSLKVYMARPDDRERAITLRLQGKSYSQIKGELGIGKGTLSGWLRKYPLSEKRIRELRDWNHQRVERFRETMQRKRESRLELVSEGAAHEIGILTKRELFLAGLFLYWAEGSKTMRYTVALTNTDPAMLRFFISWLKLFGIGRQQLKARLHIYTDMNEKAQKLFWSRQLQMPIEKFKHTYVKKTFSNKRRNYKGRFGYGTCCISIDGRDLCEKIIMGVEVLRKKYEELK